MLPALARAAVLPSQLSLYAQACTWDVQGDLDCAQAALTQASLSISPSNLTDDCRARAEFANTFVYVGQLLASLQPTLDLLWQLHRTCGHRTAHPSLGLAGDLELSCGAGRGQLGDRDLAGSGDGSLVSGVREA